MDAYFKSLLGNNKLPIFMKLLPEIHNFCQIWESLIYRLLKSLYGLKQFEKLWNQNIIAFYKLIGFRQFNKDPSIFICYSRDEISIINVYVNNFFLASNTISIFNALKQFLAKKYNAKDLEKVKTIIGWQIDWDITADTIKVH